MLMCIDTKSHNHSSSGGLAAVIYTDTLQTFIMIVGAIILTITGVCHHLISIIETCAETFSDVLMIQLVLYLIYNNSCVLLIHSI